MGEPQLVSSRVSLAFVPRRSFRAEFWSPTVYTREKVMLNSAALCKYCNETNHIQSNLVIRVVTVVAVSMAFLRIEFHVARCHFFLFWSVLYSYIWYESLCTSVVSDTDGGRTHELPVGPRKKDTVVAPTQAQRARFLRPPLRQGSRRNDIFEENERSQGNNF
jgi:hypothetical protein